MRALWVAATMVAGMSHAGQESCQAGVMPARSHARQESARSHASQVMPARSQSTRSHANQLVMVHLLCVVPAKKTCKE